MEPQSDNTSSPVPPVTQNNAPSTTPTAVQPTAIPANPVADTTESGSPQVVTPAYVQPAAVVGSDFNPGLVPSSGANDPFAPDKPVVVGTSRRRPKKLLLGGALSVLILGGAAAYYFGYYTNPSVIYSQSLKDTGKGYDKLVDYTNAQSKIKYKGSTGDGNFSYKSTSFSTDGQLAFKSDSDNSELNFDVGVGVGRVNADVRFLKSPTATPDIYVKAGGLKGLGGLLGTPEADDAVNKLDNTWIAIDHTTLDNIKNSAAASSGATNTFMAPNKDDIIDELHAFGKINQQYLFSTDKSKAVTMVVKKYGMETVDGHKTYHYKVALVKNNVKKYITAQQDALNTSKLGTWIKKNKYDSDTKQAFDSMQQSANNIKSSDTFEVWADVSHRIIYKLRFNEPKNNPAENYVDVGLDYKGGDSYPFFISGRSKQDSQTTTGSLIASVNTKSNTVNFKLNVKSGGPDGGTLTGNFNFKPSNTSAQISKPANAQPLAQVLNQLGLGNVLSTYAPSAAAAPSSGADSGGVYGGIQAKARNTKRQSDISSLQTQLEAFFNQNGYYPSLADMNSPAWLAAHMKSLDQTALTDPSNPTQSKKLSAVPAPNVYAYHVTADSGKACEAKDTQCTKYTLTATFEGSVNGSKTYSKSQLN